MNAEPQLAVSLGDRGYRGDRPWGDFFIAEIDPSRVTKLALIA